MTADAWQRNVDAALRQLRRLERSAPPDNEELQTRDHAESILDALRDVERSSGYQLSQGFQMIANPATVDALLQQWVFGKGPRYLISNHIKRRGTIRRWQTFLIAVSALLRRKISPDMKKKAAADWLIRY